LGEFQVASGTWDQSDPFHGAAEIVQPQNYPPLAPPSGEAAQILMAIAFDRFDGWQAACQFGLWGGFHRVGNSLQFGFMNLVSSRALPH
jgi:hypothetical protein